MKSLLPFLMLIAFTASAAEPPPPPPPTTTQPAAAARLPDRKVPAPQGWLLLVAGVALAGWIAHRRLSYL
jgi:hypothetical protein